MGLRESARRRRLSRPELVVTRTLTTLPDQVVGALGDLAQRLTDEQQAMRETHGEIRAVIALLRVSGRELR